MMCPVWTHVKARHGSAGLSHAAASRLEHRLVTLFRWRCDVRTFAPRLDHEEVRLEARS
jgi:hypothetical protein